MADEQTPQTPSADDIESPDFNWGQFFAADEPEEAPVAAAPTPQQATPPEPVEEFDEEEAKVLRTQISELQKMVADTAKVTTEIATRNRVVAAVEAWKQQASPAELQMADVLAEATSLEDLQAKAVMVRRVAQGADKLLQAERVKIEQEMQREFGMPVTPTYQPIPEKEKMKEALAEGDIDKASAIALKGFFH